MGWHSLCRALIRLGLCDVQGVRDKARLFRVRAQDPVVLRSSRIVESNRKCIRDNPILDPVDKGLEYRRRLPSWSTGAVCQPRNFIIAEEVLDVWRQLRGSFIVVAGSPSWDKTISLSGCLN